MQASFGSVVGPRPSLPNEVDGRLLQLQYIFGVFTLFSFRLTKSPPPLRLLFCVFKAESGIQI